MPSEIKTSGIQPQRERGIIMSGDNPKLILEDRKNQTRRLQGLDAINLRPNDWILHRVDGADFTFHKRNAIRARDLIVRCPYGVADDRLWVRESLKSVGGKFAWYSCDGTDVVIGRSQLKWRWKNKTLPARFMPKEARRITLEITKVRVERLQDISEEDINAEGTRSLDHGKFFDPVAFSGYKSDFREMYRRLWDSLHGKGAWDKNPWVWVIEFRLSKETDYAPSPL